MHRQTNGFRKFLQKHTCCLFRVGTRNKSPDHSSSSAEEYHLEVRQSIGRRSTFNDSSSSSDSDADPLERETESTGHRQGDEEVYMPSSSSQSQRSAASLARTCSLLLSEPGVSEPVRDSVPLREPKPMRVSGPVRVNEEGYVPVEPMVVSSDQCRPPPSLSPPVLRQRRRTESSLSPSPRIRPRPKYCLCRPSGNWVPLIALDELPAWVNFKNEIRLFVTHGGRAWCGDDGGMIPVTDEMVPWEGLYDVKFVMAASHGDSENCTSKSVSVFPTLGRELDLLLAEWSPGTSFSSLQSQNDGSQSSPGRPSSQTSIQSDTQWGVPRGGAFGSASCPARLDSLGLSPESPSSTQSRSESCKAPLHRSYSV